MRKLRIVIALTLILCMCLSVTALAADTGFDGVLTIVHTNDVHGNEAVEPYVKGYVDSLRAAGENVVLISGGDAFKGTSFASMTNGLDVATVMNMVGYEIFTIGNHEQMMGAELFQKIAEKAEFSILAANMKSEWLEAVPQIQNYVIKEFGGSPEVKTFGSNNQVRIVTNYKIESNDVKVDEECEHKLYIALKGFYDKQDLSEYDFTHLTNDVRGIQSSSKIQPTVARELLRNAVWAVLASLVLIFIYIAIRFRNWQFGMAGVFALFHDSFLTIGMFSLFYKVLPFTMEIDQNFIAAILTVIGYSINNVVVIFDRVRENLALYPKRSNYDNFNAAINGTLGRNVNTAATTLVTLLVIFIFGGEVIRGFVFAMFLGIAFGTYSGIFVSNPLAYDLLKLNKKKADREEELKK